VSIIDARRTATLQHADTHTDLGACVVDDGVVTTRCARVHAAVASSRGSRRRVNEDCHSALDGNCALFVVADGVGGGALAAHASRHLVASVHGVLEGGPIDAQTVGAALLDADRKIDASIASASDAAGAATVALCAAIDASLSRWLVAWVGDCRVYRVHDRDGIAELLTVDDTYAHLREPAPDGASPHDPARMIGNGAVDAPNVRHVELHARQMLVLCSDGLHKHVDAAGIGRILHGSGRLTHRCRLLVESARTHGSRDDATVLVVRRRERFGAMFEGKAV